MPTLFTYGTLRRGERNHIVLERQGAVFLREDSITATPAGFLQDIPLIKQGEGFVPGELYAISDEALEVLDRFEGVAVGMYRRLMTVMNSAGVFRTTGTHMRAFVYWPTERTLNEVDEP